MDESIQYFKTKPERIEYLGERYFKFSFSDDKTVQVCLSVGDVKKGKSNTFGVYLISKMTFLSNYFVTGYILPITQKEYEDQFQKVVKLLY